jgi:ABC-type lipoprotein export system ATPase subunit
LILIDLYSNLEISAVIAEFPLAADFFSNLNIPELDTSVPLPLALEQVSEEWLDENGLTRETIVIQFADFLQMMTTEQKNLKIKQLTILGGKDKSGNAENLELVIYAGEIISIVGSTGSGKSRLLADIECLAQGDTPTGRQILVNGKSVSEAERFELDGKLVAMLSQNMNFVVDLSVSEFLEMHTRSRSIKDSAKTIVACFDLANDLAGEKFTLNTKVTMLSGGQSRALMIADCALISRSPVVLIDEIENAGVDRVKALSVLAEKGKIVLISTHDPILALNADMRLVIKNGGISNLLETSEEEKTSLAKLYEMYRATQNARELLRIGERILM